jgi:hypothetical protein
LRVSSEGLRLCGQGEDDGLFLELYDKELLEKDGLSGSLGRLQLVINSTTLVHYMEASCLRFPELTLRHKYMTLPRPNGTVHESVLKYEIDRLRKSDYVPASGVPTEVLEQRRSGHGFCHLVTLEDLLEDGQV